MPLDDARLTSDHDSIAHGIVVVDGMVHRVQLQVELLYFDVRSLLRHYAVMYREIADNVSQYEDLVPKYYNNLIRSAKDIEWVLSLDHSPWRSGSHVELGARPSMPIWSVEDDLSAHAYARLLLEHSAPWSEDAHAEFCYSVAEDVAELQVVPSRKKVASYVGGYVHSEIVEEIIATVPL